MPTKPRPKYLCREEHAEDLTDLVDAALQGADTGGVTIERVAVKETSDKVKTVIVKCSLLHENVFEIEVA